MRYPRHYFAYGLNMDRAGMGERCPGARVVARASLADYTFVINVHGVATVVPCVASIVHGVLWRITYRDERALDAFEGVAERFYRKRVLGLHADHGRVDSTLVYIATDPTPGRPRPGYLERVLLAARSHGLDERYLVELQGWAAAPRRSVRGARSRPSSRS